MVFDSRTVSETEPLTRAELKDLVASAKESVTYHEDSVVWCDACAAQVAAEVAPFEGAVADAASALQAASGSSADRPRALQSLAMCTADLQVMTDAAARAKTAALKIHSNVDEAKARLAEYEKALASAK